jgi:uncharacterized protein (TIGR03435 family)
MCLLFCAATSFVTAQPMPQFEVASVKPASTREVGGARTHPGGRVELRGCTLHYLVMLATNVESFQVATGPAWIDNDRYDIDAKPPDSSQSSQSSPPDAKAPMNHEQRSMLQSLLAERFQLKFHRETKEGPVYVLVRGGNTLKLAEPKEKNAYPWAGLIGRGTEGVAGINESMSDLAKRLSGYLHRPVLDHTGLAGSYDFHAAYRTDDDERPDTTAMILACMREIGLKLEASKGSIETIIIDHVERPSGN